MNVKGKIMRREKFFGYWFIDIKDNPDDEIIGTPIERAMIVSNQYTTKVETYCTNGVVLGMPHFKIPQFVRVDKSPRIEIDDIVLSIKLYDSYRFLTKESECITHGGFTIENRHLPPSPLQKPISEFMIDRCIFNIESEDFVDMSTFMFTKHGYYWRWYPEELTKDLVSVFILKQKDPEAFYSVLESENFNILSTTNLIKDLYSI